MAAHPGRETNMGGAQRDFSTTAWSKVIGARSPDEETRRRSLEHLAGRYWRPVYHYIRHRQSCANEDAKDLTQQFFLWILETGFAAKIEPGRGRFRGFLKVSLAHFLDSEYRARHRQKRGGSATILPLDAMTGPDLGPAAGSESPDELFDRKWREQILTAVFEILEKAYKAEHREDWVELWRAYDLGAGSRPDHAGLAEKFGLSRRDVAYRLAEVRKRVRQITSELVSETVDDGASLKDEMRVLFG